MQVVSNKLKIGVTKSRLNSLLAQSHNTSLLPPKILHDHCLQVLLGHEDVLREIKNNAYANFWGVKEVYYGICASSEFQRGSKRRTCVDLISQVALH